MIRRLCGIYAVLSLVVIVCLTFSGCRDDGCVLTKQKVSDDDVLKEQIEIADDLPEITSDYLYALTVKGPVKGNYLLIDCRSREEFRQETIPTAVFLAPRDIAMMDDLPEDRSVRVIFFCDGAGCDADARAATLALKHGYENVGVLQGGMKGWLEDGFPTVAGKGTAAVDDGK